MNDGIDRSFPKELEEFATCLFHIKNNELRRHKRDYYYNIFLNDGTIGYTTYHPHIVETIVSHLRRVHNIDVKHPDHLCYSYKYKKEFVQHITDAPTMTYTGTNQEETLNTPVGEQLRTNITEVIYRPVTLEEQIAMFNARQEQR